MCVYTNQRFILTTNQMNDVTRDGTVHISAAAVFNRTPDLPQISIFEYKEKIFECVKNTVFCFVCVDGNNFSTFTHALSTRMIEERLDNFSTYL